jgi:Ca2+-binding EF-hand superfamily protein
MSRAFLQRAAALVLVPFAASAFVLPPLPAHTQAPPVTQDPAAPPKRRNPQMDEDDQLVTKFFNDCDENGNGWISFREAESAMSLNRDSFAIFDKDRDGRIDPIEFKIRYDVIKKLGGAFPAPTSSGHTRRSTSRSPEALVRAYDRNADGILDTLELKRLFAETSGSTLPPEVAMGILDQDKSGKLEAPELAHLAAILSRSSSSEPAGPAPESIDELFGKRVKRSAQSGATAQSLWIPGPVTAFKRLDFDEDGQLSASDLIELARPLQVPVRIHALIAALDTDGDGTLSEAEFRASMR